MGGNVKFITEENSILVTTKNNYCELENCLLLICIQFKLICGTFLRYKQIYGEKLPLVKIRENKLFRHRQGAIGRPHIHTHHIHMNEHIFFAMLRAQIIGICNVEMKIWGFTPSSGAFSKWLSRKKCLKNKDRNFCISTSNYHRYTQFISIYMFLRMTNAVILVKKICTYQKDPWWSPFLAKKSLSVWNQLICQSQYCLKQ